jgi:hypothetical protein
MTAKYRSHKSRNSRYGSLIGTACFASAYNLLSLSTAWAATVIQSRHICAMRLLFSVAKRIDFRSIEPTVKEEFIVRCKGKPGVQLSRFLAEGTKIQDRLN